MNKQRKTSNILNVFQYDETTGAVTLPSTLVLTAPDSDVINWIESVIQQY
jgi:hypothetical protein